MLDAPSLFRAGDVTPPVARLRRIAQDEPATGSATCFLQFARQALCVEKDEDIEFDKSFAACMQVDPDDGMARLPRH